MPQLESHVRLTDLGVRHPSAAASTLAIAGLNFSVQRGEQIAVIGPSGAGKTTLVNALACALRPATGTLSLMGQNPWALPRPELHRLRARLFLAPQVPPLPPRQRVVNAVLAGRLPQMGFWRSLGSLVYPRDVQRARDALAKFDLADKLYERVDRLSGGERQRVGLARAWVAEAELVLIDEPLSALDPTRAHEAIAVLCRAARANDATLITTLHQVDVARANFERIVALRAGRLVFDLPAAQVGDELLRALYADHEHELTEPAHAPSPVVDRAPGTGAGPLICR